MSEAYTQENREEQKESPSAEDWSFWVTYKEMRGQEGEPGGPPLISVLGYALFE